MDSSSDFTNSLRQRLESRNLPRETIETLVGLVETAISTVDGGSDANRDVLTRLSRACEDNVTLLALITQQAGELDALKRITFNLTSSLELKVVLDQVVQEAMRLVKDARLVQIHLSQGEKMIPSASLDAEGAKDLSMVGGNFDHIIKDLSRTTEMVLIEDAASGEGGSSIPGDGKGSIIGLPLKMGNRLVGIMILARTQVGPFSRAEIRLLKLLADQASIAIVNARLHQVVSQQARFDLLTCLPNRLALEERLYEEITCSLSTGKSFSVIMMDLDGLKRVNDSYGHEGGDEALRQVARFLQESLRATDFVARFGGDEFTLILPATDLSQAILVAEKQVKRLSELLIYLPQGATTTVSASAGIAVHPEHAITPSGLLRAADEALYNTKRTNPGGFKVAVGSDA